MESSLSKYFEDYRAFRGLTFWQPWLWTITDLPEDLAKRVENRGWPPWKRVRFLALHAGSTYDQDGAWSIREDLKIDVPPRKDIAMKSIVGICRIAGCVTESDDRWFMGPYGWLLADVFKLPEPIPFKGAQGLWEIPNALRLDLGRKYCAALENSVDKQELEPRSRLQLHLPGM